MQAGWFYRDLRESLVSQPLRTGLTCFAVGVGVLTLTLLLAILSGLNLRAERMVEDFGANVAMIEIQQQGASVLDARLLRQLRHRFPDIQFAGERQQTLGNVPGSTAITVIAAEPAYPKIRGLSLIAGRFLDAADMTEAAARGVAGPALASERDLRPGATLNLGETLVTIVGVGGNGHHLLLPPSFRGGWETDAHQSRTFQRLWLRHGERDAPEALVRAVEAELTRAVPGVTLSTTTPEQLIAETRRMSRAIRQVFGSVAVLCLLLGGSTLTSLMTLNVRQRIREIGLRMSMGADGKQIFGMFLAEGMVLSIFAATLGTGVALLLLHFGQARIDFPVATGPAVLLLPPAVALVTGLAFSLLPARLAATLSPAEALRGE
ncbi:MAG: ABC transporter permease [Verrucomicrobia bacterium]|nr:ABC transporter permease [Verrucomicrobiota bacterium]MCH8514250.1 ABC transporter permease [Kiritimatiellia bacterium]